MNKGIKRQLEKVRKKVEEDIHELAQGGFYAAGLSSEGYVGGYRDALDDIGLALNGVKPRRRDWWTQIERK